MHGSNGGAPSEPPASPEREPSQVAEAIRVELAEAWGEMGAAWGVTPAIARVQAYLMARQEPLTEREVREALGLSHRAASLALAEAESWGIVERVPEPRRVGRRGPAGHGLSRGRRPLAVVRAGHRRAQGPRGRPDRRGARGEGTRGGGRPRGEPRRHGARGAARLARPRSSSSSACSTAPSGSCRSSSRASSSARSSSSGAIPDATILRLFDLLGGLPDEDVIDLVEALSRLSPTAARRATKLMSGVVRTVAR